MEKKSSMLNKNKVKKTKSIEEINQRSNSIFAILIFLIAGCIGISIAFIIKHFFTF